VATTAGVLRLKRRYWTCRVCQQGEYAADDGLGIEGFLSRRLRQLASWVGASATSFAKGVGLLEQVGGVKIAEETLRQCCERSGQRQQEEQGFGPLACQRFQAALGEVEFQVDALKVSTREEGWKDMKAVLVLKRPLGPPASLDHWDQRRLPEPTARCTFAAIEPIESFQGRWRGWLAGLGIGDPAQVTVNGDGAEWIWNAATVQFPGCRERLDPFHGFEHLTAGLEPILGQATAPFRQAFAEGRRALLEGGWSGLVDFYGRVRQQAPPQCASLESMLRYFAAHAGRLDYRQALQEGRSLGSGPVEGFCKTLGLRLKSRGARWNRANANRIAALISYYEATTADAVYSLTV
jgi:hypothetical protein